MFVDFLLLEQADVPRHHRCYVCNVPDAALASPENFCAIATDQPEAVGDKLVKPRTEFDLCNQAETLQSRESVATSTDGNIR